MNMKRIICLILAAVLLLGLLASAISVLVYAEEDPAASTETIGALEEGEREDLLKNGDKIILFILGALVPAAIFIFMIIKMNKGKA